MSGAILRHGNYRTSTGPGFAVAHGPQQIATFANTNNHSGTIIWYDLLAYMGKYSGNPVGRLGALWMAGNNDRPGGVAGYTEEFTPTNVYVDGAGGQLVRARLTAPIVDSAGYDYTFAATARNGDLSVSMYHADDPAVSGRNRNLWRKNITGNIPVDAVGSTVTYEGQLNIWMEGERNAAPNRPGVTTISGGTGNRRPTMRNTFSDANETLNNGVKYDRLERHRHEIWWDGARRWNQTYTATAAEQAGRYSQRQIGIDVPYDKTVEHRVYHIDRMGAESAYRSATFVVQSGATVDRPTSPSGRVTNLSNPGNIVAVYRNNAGLNANAVRVGVFTTSGTLIKQSAIISTTVAPNAAISRAWSDLAYTLSPGQEVGVAVQARASNGVWSNWSAASSITANAAPNTPTVHSPSNGFVSSELLHLQINASDPDQPMSQLSAQVELYSNTGALLATEAMDQHPTANRFWKVPAAITSHQMFQWRARVSDGYLWSGWSPLTTYVYAPVPAVAITGPASPITTSQPNITWDNPGTHWRVTLTDSEGVVVYDTGERAGATTNHQIGGSWLPTQAWRNGQELSVSVSIRNSAGLWGSSAPVSILLQYEPIDPLVLTVGEYSLPGVEGTHAIDSSWDHTAYAEEEFDHYRVERYEITGPGGAEIDASYTVLGVVRDASENRLLDFDVTSRQWYRVYVSQAIRRGVDVIYSEPVFAEMMVSWWGTLLHMPFDPINTFVWLQYGATGSPYEPSRSERYQDRAVQPMNGSAPIGYVGRARELAPSGEYTILPSDDRTSTERLDDLYRVMDYQNPAYAPDGRPHKLCWREGRGGRRGRLYVRLLAIDDRVTQYRAHVVTLEFAERAHRVGVVEGGGQ